MQLNAALNGGGIQEIGCVGLEVVEQVEVFEENFDRDVDPIAGYIRERACDGHRMGCGR